MSEKDNKDNQEEKPMGTVQMVLGIASFVAAIYVLYVVFAGQYIIKFLIQSNASDHGSGSRSAMNSKE